MSQKTHFEVERFHKYSGWIPESPRHGSKQKALDRCRVIEKESAKARILKVETMVVYETNKNPASLLTPDA